MCLGAGAHELGTRKREKNFVFTFDSKRVGSSQIEIPQKGAFGCYFATKSVGTYNNISLNTYSTARQTTYSGFLTFQGINEVNVLLTGAAQREHQRVVIAQTSVPAFGPFTFHMVPMNVKLEPVTVGVLQGDTIEAEEFKVDCAQDITNTCS